MEILNSLLNNKTEILAIVGGIVTVASMIVKLTPTPKDDEFLKKIVSLLNIIAINKK